MLKERRYGRKDREPDREKNDAINHFFYLLLDWITFFITTAATVGRVGRLFRHFINLLLVGLPVVGEPSGSSPENYRSLGCPAVFVIGLS